MSARVNRVLRLLNCMEWVEDELRRSEPEAQHWVRITLEPARRAAGTAFEALRSAARRGDPKARVALDAFVASLAINDAQKSLARARDAAASEGTYPSGSIERPLERTIHEPGERAMASSNFGQPARNRL